jgi:hypothetical protein
MPIFSVQLLSLSRKENTYSLYEGLKSLMPKRKGKKLNLYYCLPVLYMWNTTSVYTGWLQLFFNPCLSLYLGILVALESAYGTVQGLICMWIFISVITDLITF